MPDLLSAAGFTSVGFARVDGAPTFYESIEPGGAPPPKPGSSAEQMQQMGSADFTWHGPGGGSILAHYIAYGLYCTGDNIDFDEQLQVPGGHLGVYDGDQPGFTDGKIAEYLAALQPYAKTPYLFVPVGCDFQRPKEELISYLDGYNRRQYPKTGVWAVAAPFDDYAELVAAHKDAIPDWTTELSPYFMGFYGSRAVVKRRVREAARPFFSTEALAVALGAEGRVLFASLAPAFQRLTRADHHDFITGTATDDVQNREQLPLLDGAESAGQTVFAQAAAALAQQLPPTSGALGRLVLFNDASSTATQVVEVPWDKLPQPLHASSGDLERINRKGQQTLRLAVDSLPPFGWRAVDLLPGDVAPAARVTLSVSDAQVVLSNEHVRATWTHSGGAFALSSLMIDGQEALAPPTFNVGDYADDGGLWPQGNEILSPCTHTPSPEPAGDEQLHVVDQSALSVTVQFVSATAVREARLDAGDAGLRLALIAAAGLNRTRTVLFHFAAAAGAPLRTSLAGGFAERPPERVYTPTFWPAVEWLSVGNWAVLLRQSTGVRLSAAGDVELMAMRWAPSEQCDIEGGMGDDPDIHRIEWLVTAAATPAQAARAAQSFNRPITWLDTMPTGSGALAAEGSLASVDGEGILTAVKPAERGDGVIVRALLLPGPVTVHLSPQLAGLARTRTDAVERDLADLDGTGDTITLDAATFGSIATVRLR